jgi:hypothetical protein
MGFRGRLTMFGRARGHVNVPLTEWRSLFTLRANILIEAQESDVEKTLVALTGDFRCGTCEWNSLEHVPDASPVATIIVRDVTHLTTLELQRLMAWLNTTSPRVQLIATSTTPVFLAVQQGRFPADVYYRLNTVVLADAHRGAA